MAQYNFLDFYTNPDNKFYSYDEELYTVTFPKEWAQTHKTGTGPKECKNCNYYGSWNGVFIGYCINCAVHVYNCERGFGFYEFGEEMNVDISTFLANTEVDKKSAKETYLKGVELDDIGDKEFYDSSGVKLFEKMALKPKCVVPVEKEEGEEEEEEFNQELHDIMCYEQERYDNEMLDRNTRMISYDNEDYY